MQKDDRGMSLCQRSNGLRGDICVEKKLQQLFDFQKFERNSGLQRIIDDVHARYTMKELELDDLMMVSAAGVPEAAGLKNAPDKNRG